MDPRAVKKILVPTDFSAPSDEALRTAVGFAKVFGASIELVHVYVEPAYVLPPPVEMATFPFDMAQVLARLGEALEAQRDRVREAGIPVEVTSLSGRPAQQIVAHAKKVGTDLIVMGTHGRSGFQHVLLGSVAERVVHHSPCPVLVVPTRPSAAAG
jgi:universal stress protein A